MTESDIKTILLENLDAISKKISSGKDVEITTCKNGIAIKTINKTKIFASGQI